MLTDSKGLINIFTEGLRTEGPGFLMKGWTPAWLRLAYAIHTAMVIEADFST
jgi:hypothetical protein